MTFCNATPLHATWPVCALQEGHRDDCPDDPHQSADFWWADGSAEFHLKGERGI